MKIIPNVSLVLYALLSAASASSEVLVIADTGFVVENKIQVASNKAETWEVFTQQVDRWWPVDHTWWGEASTLSIEAYAGGCFCEKSEDMSAEHMRISFVEPHNRIVMTGGLGPLQGMGMYGALTWTFETIESGTEVTMTYRVNGINPGGFSELAPIVDQVQALQLGGLKVFIQEIN